jgi:hypothetical protein
MDLRLATLNAVSFYLLHNLSTLNQCGKLSCVTVVCKHFASYQGYSNYKWDLTLSLLMSYIYGRTFGNAESRLFLFAAQCFNIESMQKVIAGLTERV